MVGQVPKERLLAVALGQGPTGATLDLRHKRRAQPSSMDEVGRLLLNICQAVPQVSLLPAPDIPLILFINLYHVHHTCSCVVKVLVPNRCDGPVSRLRCGEFWWWVAGCCGFLSFLSIRRPGVCALAFLWCSRCAQLPEACLQGTSLICGGRVCAQVSTILLI